MEKNKKDKSKVVYLDKGTYYIRVMKNDVITIGSKVDYNLSVIYTENFG